MKRFIILSVTLACTFVVIPSAHAQKAPEAGYIFPPGGKAGATVDVIVGGYDWTPDMEFFTHDPRAKLAPSGALGPILLPPPPYWFGAKGRIGSLPLPREFSAKLTIPAGFPPGPLFWQAANANGCTSARVFIVGAGTELIEDEKRTDAQTLPSLPITVSGRLLKNEEVDRYRFVALKDGPITCDLTARRLGSKFQGILEVHDKTGRRLADALGAGGDPCLTFSAKAGTEYVVSVHDVDFGGDRSYVYRLSVSPGPRVLAAIPAAGKFGETREVEFVVDTGAGKLDSIKTKVAFPTKGRELDFRLPTPHGPAPAFPLLVSDEPGVTGVLSQVDAVGRHAFTWKKGDAWSLSVQARRIGSPLDVALAIVGPDGKELARNDDLPGTTDAGLDFTAPADGVYQVVITDLSGTAGTRASTYRLVVRKPAPDFTLRVATQRVGIHVGEKANLSLQVIRKGGFQGPIAIKVTGLPPGVSIPAKLVIPGDKNAFVIPLECAKTAGTTANVVTIEGTADLAPLTTGLFSRLGPPQKGGPVVTRMAMARANVNLAPWAAENDEIPNLLVAVTLKAVFKGQPVDQDTGRKVPLGSTFPAEVLVERLNGFSGEVTLQMAATQSYQMQGITGGTVIVPPGVGKTHYPVYMPEWLETTRTSRCGMVGVAKVTDPKGKVRYALNSMTGYITMTMEGALLKIAAEEPNLLVPAGQPIDVRLKISRLPKLSDAAKLELRLPEGLAGQFKMESLTVPPGKEHVIVRVSPAAKLQGIHVFAIRATALQNGRYPAISEAIVTVEFVAPVPGSGR